MEHSYFIDKLSAYFDGDLPDYERMAIEEHLESCEECRAQLDQYRRLNDLVEAKSQLAGSDYWEQSAQKIERAIGSPAAEVVDITPKKSSGLFWKISAVAASVAVLTFISLHYTEIEEPVKQKMMAPSAPAITRPSLDSIKSRDTSLVANREELKVEKPAAEIKEMTTGKKVETVTNEKTAARKDVADLQDKLEEKLGQAPQTPKSSPAIAEGGVTDGVEKEKTGQAKSASEGTVMESIKFSAPSPVLNQSKSAFSKVAGGAQMIARTDSAKLDLLADLRHFRDSLFVTIRDRNFSDLSTRVMDSVAINPADSSYQSALDSLISAVYQIGRKSGDSTERISSRDYLAEFPIKVTERQQKTIDSCISELDAHKK